MKKNKKETQNRRWTFLTGDMDFTTYGGKWYRKINKDRYHIIELMNWRESCGDEADGGPTYNVTLSEIDLKICEDVIGEALETFGWPSDGLDDYGDPIPNFDLMKVEALHGHGSKAPLGSWDGNNYRKLLAEAKRESRELDDPDAHEEAMNRSVNKIGSTAREYMQGDIHAAIHRAYPKTLDIESSNLSSETDLIVPITLQRVRWAIRAAMASATDPCMRSRIGEIQIHLHGYAESGYSDPDSGIILCGDWNSISVYNRSLNRFDVVDETIRRLAAVLEKIGCELEWEDEWDACSCCHKLVRVMENSYSWQPSYTVHESGEISCFECVDQVNYLQDLEGSCTKINQMFDPSEHGYVLVRNRFEHGFHPGQDSDQEMIGKLMTDAGFSRWLFSLDSKGQFDIRFSLWLHEEEANRCDGEGIILAKRVIEQGNTDGPSVSEAMKRGLEEANMQMREIQKSDSSNIIVSRISPVDVTTREVSIKDFVDGKIFD